MKHNSSLSGTPVAPRPHRDARPMRASHSTFGALRAFTLAALLLFALIVSGARGALAAPPSVAAWGLNSSGQLGDGTTDPKSVPVLVPSDGVLSGKIVTQLVGGSNHTLALCSDGTVAAWGSNSSGQLGNNSTTNSPVPIDVTNSGVLNGKTVTQLSAGLSHSLALCNDGTVATWGNNFNGQLGNGGSGTANNSSVPINITNSGALNGKRVTQLGAGGAHSLALCSDGTVISWGSNSFGQLGNGSSGEGFALNSPVPGDITNSGALNGKTVTQLDGGANHTMALLSDGTVAACGNNGSGRLGDGTVTNRSVPVAVDRSGVLNGKTVTQVSAGPSGLFSLALLSDGTVATWGSNSSGQLGNGSSGASNSSSVPVLVTTSGALSGKRVTQASAGTTHNLALCSDGTVVSWGNNSNGQLGNGSSGTANNSNVPVDITGSGILNGNTVTQVSAGGTHSLALVAASAPAPTITSFTPTSGRVGTVVTITGTGFTGATAVSFNNTPAASFTVDSGTQITATVAANTTTGKISVTAPGGTATSADDFVVTANSAPTLDPTIKPSAPGPNDLVITDPRGTDPENDPLTFTFAYAINGTTVAGEADKPNRVDLKKYPNLAVPGAVLTVTFTAFDGTNTTTVTRSATIQAPPVANPTSGTAKAGVQSIIGPITGSDPNGLTLRYVLLTQPTSGSAFLAGSANNVQLYYTSARTFSGADSVTFQVVNSEGRRSDPATISITVQGNSAPTAGNNSMTVKAGVRTEIPLVASDPEGDELRYRITRQPTNGTAFLANNSSGGVSLFYTSRATYSGADSVQFTATDPSGATSAPGTISLTVVGNSAPTADNTTLDAISGQRASVLLSGNDADGDALVRYRITKQPSNGSAFLAGSGNNVQLFYTSNAGYVGSDSAQFTVTDSTGRASAPATVSITVSPAPGAAKNSGGNS